MKKINTLLGKLTLPFHKNWLWLFISLLFVSYIILIFLGAAEIMVLFDDTYIFIALGLSICISLSLTIILFSKKTIKGLLVSFLKFIIFIPISAYLLFVSPQLIFDFYENFIQEKTVIIAGCFEEGNTIVYGPHKITYMTIEKSLPKKVCVEYFTWEQPFEEYGRVFTSRTDTPIDVFTFLNFTDVGHTQLNKQEQIFKIMEKYPYGDPRIKEEYNLLIKNNSLNN